MQLVDGGSTVKRLFWQMEGYSSDDAKIALQAAESMAFRFGEDMAIMQDLSVIHLANADEPPLEIVRCPEVFKKKQKEY
tara:strand:+ start:161 stop:397 length:237 start_codon:yes stop_codon:yes gene_type:complete